MIKILLFFLLFYFAPMAIGSNGSTEKIEKTFHSNGLIKTETIFKSSGIYTIREYSEIGFLIQESSFKNKALHGKSLYYSDDGKPIKVLVYEDGIQKQKIEFSELYRKADTFLEDRDEALKAKNVQKKIAPFLLLAWEHRLPICIGLLALGFFYFLFRFRRPDHKAYFKYTKSVSSFSFEGELLAAAPRRVVLNSHFFARTFYFIFTLSFCFYVSQAYPKAILLFIGVSFWGAYLLHKTYEKIQILKYGFVVEAEIEDIQYTRKVGKPKVTLFLSYDRNDNVYKLTCEIPTPKESISIGDHLSLLIDPLNLKKFMVYKFSNIRVKKSA